MAKRIFPRVLVMAATTLLAVPGALAQQPWPEGFLSRVEILALIQTLNASLLASRSATTTLEKWCADHKMAAEPKILAKRIAGADKPPSEDTRRRLDVGSSEPIKYRRVQLSCGSHVLSEADNWYVPGRLSEEMNRTLETTQTPFGKAVAPLQPFRRTIDMKMRWSPLPDGWEFTPHSAPSGEGAVPLPHDIFEHRAILYGQDQKPFSEVHETYTSGILDFASSAEVAPKD